MQVCTPSMFHALKILAMKNSKFLVFGSFYWYLISAQWSTKVNVAFLTVFEYPEVHI